jgi:CHASE2 domain-containing sensor protein
MVAGNFPELSAQGELTGGRQMATPERRSGIAGISVGGIIVIAGILMMLFWSLWIGLIVVLIGLIAFGGFVRGRWY